MTTVVNRRHETFDVYIGRGSPFGNPYSHFKSTLADVEMVASREEAIAKYRVWFEEQLKSPGFVAQVEALRGKRLGCFCKPLACHGDVIVEWLETHNSSEDKRPYLCGPIAGCTDSECKDWREEAKKRFPQAIDPMIRDYRGREAENTKQIVEVDKQDIDNSTSLLVNYVKPSVGTSMEILYAWERKIPIIIVAAPDSIVSPWLKYHSNTIVRSFKEGFELTDKLPKRQEPKIKEINCDIFEAPIEAIIHQANCQCTMGSGIAYALRSRWPAVYAADCLTLKRDVTKLGTFSLAAISDPSSRVKYVFNMYGQFLYGRDRRYTDYEAVSRGLERIRAALETEGTCYGIETIGIPYKMGCSLGGGNWMVVKTIIEETFRDAPFKTLICRKD